MVGVLRAYLASVLPEAVRSATTRELEAALARISAVPLQRLVGLLDATDLIKFARDRATAERALAAGAEARRIVAGTNAALAAAAAAGAKAGTEAAAA
jgi:hypothetical protein